MNSFRRYFIDSYLEKNIHYFNGKIVLDAGGKKINKRGNFNPKKTGSKKWIYLNIDSNTNPDFVGDINNTEFKNEEFDVVIMIELLEYLKDPMSAICEVKRILKKDGLIIFSVPFIHPLHGDRDFDYFRFTDTALKFYLNETNMKIIEVTPMGSSLAVIFDILRINFSYNKNFIFKFFYFLLVLIHPFLKLIYKFFNFKNEYINTGYFVIAKKN